MGQGNSNSRLPGSSRKHKRYIIQGLRLLDNMIEADDAEMLFALLQEGVFNKNILNTGHLLHHAASYGHHECVRVLCEYGLDVHRCDLQNGMTPLHYVAKAFGEEDIRKTVEYLVISGANIDHLGDKRCCKTALHYAIELRNVEAVQALLEHRASANLVSECEKGVSPLLLVIKETNAAMLHLLLLAGANMHKSTIWKVTQTPPMDILTYQMTKAHNNEHIKMFKLLLQGDGDLTLTLCQMPQGRQTKVTAVRTYQALKAIIERLSIHHRKLAQDFLIALFLGGFRPRGEAVAYIENHDLAAYGLMRRYLTTPQPLTDLSVKVLRRNLRMNVLYGVRVLGLLGPVRDLVARINPPQPCLIWF